MSMLKPSRRFISRYQRAKLRGIACVALLVVIVAVPTYVAVHAQQSKSAQTPIGQTLSIPGIAQPVTIGADAYGNPQVWANDELGAYAGLGYAQASSRLFEMDELRRSAYGTLAAVLGAGPDNSVLNQDILARVEGIRDAAQRRYNAASPRTQADLAAYALGVNAVIIHQRLSHTLPGEFTVLHYQPDYWQPQDSMAIGMALASSLDAGTWLTKLARAGIAGAVGSDIAQALIPDPGGVTMFDAQGHLTPISAYTTPSAFAVAGISSAVPASFDRATPAQTSQPLVAINDDVNPRRSAFGANSPFASLLGILGGHESNNFAIAGSHTASGSAILEGDPHLAIATPSTVDLVTLSARRGWRGLPGFQVQGLNIPGFSAFISLHSAAGVGLVVTDLVADSATLYLETPCTKPSAATATIFEGNCVASTQRHERIAVAGSTATDLVVTTTPHGPVLNAAIPQLDAFGSVALKQTLSDSAWTIDGLFDLLSAQDWQTTRSALGHISLGLNWLYGDRAGHIGYQTSGLIPRVNEAASLEPVSGADPDNEWHGFVAFGDLPSVFDPPEGLLATANNPLVPRTYAPHGAPVYLSRYADENWRIQRLYQQLLTLTADDHRVTAQEAERVALDDASPFGQELITQAIAAIQRAGLPANDPDAAASLADLTAWATGAGTDAGQVTAASRGALLYEVFSAEATRDVAESAIGDELYVGIYASSVTYTVQLQALAQQIVSPMAPFWGATSPVDASSARDRGVAQALGEADALLRTALGTDRSHWTWGNMHTLTYNHPLAIGLDPTGQVFAAYAIGTFPRNGDTTTVDTGGWNSGIGQLPTPTVVSSATQPSAVLNAAQLALRQDAGAAARTVWDLDGHFSAILLTGASGDPHSSHWADQAVSWRSGEYDELAF